MFNKSRIFLHFSLREKIWFVLLFVLSGIARVAVLVFPFRWVMRYLGAQFQNKQLSVLVTQQQLELAWRIGVITTVATKYTPWESKCLIQAMVARLLLSYYEIPYVIYIGMTRTKQPEAALKAHAWLSVGRWVITGQDGHQVFTIASSFVAPSVLTNASPLVCLTSASSDSGQHSPNSINLHPRS
ncbi:MAG: lasso peptide biosynthesis B2 protein [Methylococcaceae bacterium]